MLKSLKYEIKGAIFNASFKLLLISFLIQVIIFFSNDKSIQEVLSTSEITNCDYYWTLSISPEIDYEIDVKRILGSYFVKNYNPVLVKAWKANLVFHPVHDYYKALTYMTSYLSKSENEVSEALKLAAREIKKQNLNVCDAMKKITNLFISTSQLPVQEAVYKTY